MLSLPWHPLATITVCLLEEKSIVICGVGSWRDGGCVCVPESRVSQWEGEWLGLGPRLELQFWSLPTVDFEFAIYLFWASDVLCDGDENTCLFQVIRMKYLRGVKFVIHCLTSILSEYLFLSLKFVRKGQDMRSKMVNHFCLWMWPEFHVFLKVWIKESLYRPESEMP